MDAKLIANILYIALAAITIFFAIRAFIRERRGIKKLSAGFGKFSLWNNNRAVHNGINFSYSYVPGGQYTPPHFLVSVAFPSGAPFSVRKEKHVDGLFKLAGVSKEMQTGDPAFDKAFYVVAESESFARQMFADHGRREAISSFFGLGWPEVFWKEGSLYARWLHFDMTEDIDPGFVKKTAELLAVLSSWAPEKGSVQQKSPAAPKIKKYVLSALACVALAASLAFFVINAVKGYWPMDLWGVFEDSLWFGLPVLVFFTLVSIRLLKGRSSSHADIAFVLTLAALSIPHLAFEAEVFLNGFNDTTLPAVHKTQVIGRYMLQGKKDSDYYLFVTSWRGKNVETIDVKASVYREAKNGSTLDVKTRKGALGFERILSVRLSGDQVSKSDPADRSKDESNMDKSIP